MTPFTLDISPHREEPISWMLRTETAGIVSLLAPWIVGVVILCAMFGGVMVLIEREKAKRRGMRRDK